MIEFLKKRRSRALLLLLMLFVLALCSEAQTNTRRVRFPPGRTTVVLHGVIRGHSEDRYILRAGQGQVLTAHLVVSRNQYASIQVRDPRGRVIDSDTGTDAGEDYIITLPSTGDYRIDVFAPDTADDKDVARYTLEVTIR